MSEPILQVRDLRVQYETPAGPAEAGDRERQPLWLQALRSYPAERSRPAREQDALHAAVPSRWPL